MHWAFTADVHTYAARVWDLLAARPVENTIALTVIDELRTGRWWPAAAPLLGWYGDARVSGAVLMTPPFPLLLAVVPDDALPALLRALRDSVVPGVTGESTLVDAFAGAWCDADSGSPAPAVRRRERLYALAALEPPPPPRGRPRRATSHDFALAARWSSQFQAEVGSVATDVDAYVSGVIETSCCGCGKTPAVIRCRLRRGGGRQLARLASDRCTPRRGIGLRVRYGGHRCMYGRRAGSRRGPRRTCSPTWRTRRRTASTTGSATGRCATTRPSASRRSGAGRDPSELQMQPNGVVDLGQQGRREPAQNGARAAPPRRSGSARPGPSTRREARSPLQAPPVRLRVLLQQWRL